MSKDRVEEGSVGAFGGIQNSFVAWR